MYKERTKKCEHCGKPFKTQKPKQKFCSIDCANKSRSGENHHNYVEKLELTCEHCGKTFSVIPSHWYTKYCSNECKWASQVKPERAKAICRSCGREFFDYESSGGVCTRKDCREFYEYYHDNEHEFPQLGVEPTDRICPVCGKHYFGQLPTCDYLCGCNSREIIGHDFYMNVDREAFRYVQILRERGELAPAKVMPLNWGY